MNKVYKRKISLILLSLLVFLNCSSVFATTKPTQITKDLDQLINTILENYMYDITEEELYEGAAFGMSLVLDDYSNYLNQSQLINFVMSITGNVQGIGISILPQEDGFYILDVLPDSPAKSMGIITGDKILSINDIDIKNHSTDQVHDLIDKSEKEIKLNIERNGKKLTYKITKDTAKYSSVSGMVIDDLIKGGNKSIGYISITKVDELTSENFEATVRYLQDKGVKKIILDLRNNPGGLLHEAIDVCKQIVPKGSITHTVDKNGVTTSYVSKLEKQPFEQIAVLINGNSASAAELIAAALQDTGSKVFGETSFGKGVVQELFVLPKGDGLSMTIMEYLRRDGKKLHKLGVTPDFVVDVPKYIHVIDTTSPNSVKVILKELGYAVGSGNDYDPITIESIKAFQKTFNLPITGVVNDITATELNRRLYANMQTNDIIISKAYEFLNK